MFKKVTITTALSAALLFGGGLTSAGASASLDSPQAQENVSQEEGSQQTSLQDFLDQFFGQNNSDKDEAENQESNNSDADEQQSNTPGKKEEDQNNQSEDDKADEESSDSSAEGLSEFEEEVVDLTNEEREENGLEPLEADEELSDVARDKSDDMQSNGYFAHESPTYGSPFDMMDEYDIEYGTAGENIAHGQQSPEEVVDGWMNSEGHRENILNSDFTHIGVGHVEEGNYWTQEFTGNQ